MPDSSDIDAILNACQTAASDESLTICLNDLAAVLPKNTGRKRDRVALFLITNVITIGSTASAALDKCLDGCGPHATLGACSQIFLQAASIKIDSPCPFETALRTIRRLLLTIPETSSDSRWFQHLDTATDASSKKQVKNAIDDIASLALLIPSQITNACHFQKIVLPAWCVRSRYLPRLIECALAMDALLQTLSADLYVHTLVRKIVHNGGSDEVAIAFHEYFRKSNPDLTWFRNTILETARSLSTPRECGTLLRSIIRHLISKVQGPENQSVDMYCRENTSSYLNLVCLPILETCRDVREAFVQLSVLSSSSSGSRTTAKADRVFCHCVAMLLASCKTPDEAEDDESSDEEEGSLSVECTSVLERHLNEVASCWSETVFVQRTDASLQHHVTNFILSSISMLDKENQNPYSALVGTILNGVSVRLSSSIDKIRRDGMRVGEALAILMDQPLKFDEIHDNQESSEENSFREDASDQPNLSNSKENVRKKSRRRKPPKQIDPDAEYISDEESSDSAESFEETDEYSDCDDSIWDDSDEMIPYNLDDDEEDLRETAVPHYLRECLDMLQTPDTNESAANRHDTGLQTVTSLVRSNPADLPDVTVPLCRALTTMENKFDLPNFQSNLASGLLSLSVMQPIRAGEYEINEFFRGSYGLDVRLLILRALEEAAYEMCGAKALKEGREKRDAQKTSPGQRISGKRRLVPGSSSDEIQVSADRAVASIESRTRRWGKGGRHTKPLTVENKFGAVAPAWFYALVSGFVQNKDDTTLWGGANGGRLLTSFLLALSTIVECSGLTPGTEILARDLCEFAWSFRTVDVPEVRMALLIALASSLAALRDEALMGVLYSLNDLPEYLRGIALEDSDQTCRTIASTISSNVSQVLSSMMDSRSIQS